MAESPAAQFRADYRPPAFLVDTVDLRFDLDPEATVVRSRLAMRRNPAASGEAVPLRQEDAELEGNREGLEAAEVLRVGRGDNDSDEEALGEGVTAPPLAVARAGDSEGDAVPTTGDREGKAVPVAPTLPLPQAEPVGAPVAELVPPPPQDSEGSAEGVAVKEMQAEAEETPAVALATALALKPGPLGVARAVFKAVVEAATVAVTKPEEEAAKSPVADIAAEAVPGNIPEALCCVVVVTDFEGEGLALRGPLGEGEAEGHRDAEADTQVVGETEGEGKALRVDAAVALTEGDTLGSGVPVRAALEVAECELPPRSEGEAEEVAEGEGEATAEFEGGALEVAARLRTADTEAQFEAEADIVTAEGESEPAALPQALLLGVAATLPLASPPPLAVAGTDAVRAPTVEVSPPPLLPPPRLGEAVELGHTDLLISTVSVEDWEGLLEGDSTLEALRLPPPPLLAVPLGDTEKLRVPLIVPTLLAESSALWLAGPMLPLLLTEGSIDRDAEAHGEGDLDA